MHMPTTKQGLINYIRFCEKAIKTCNNDMKRMCRELDSCREKLREMNEKEKNDGNNKL